MELEGASPSKAQISKITPKQFKIPNHSVNETGRRASFNSNSRAASFNNTINSNYPRQITKAELEEQTRKHIEFRNHIENTRLRSRTVEPLPKGVPTSTYNATHNDKAHEQ